ncbi:hypothetical protein GE09DRAFT_330251 [Coniochaeta sp. 2T2.1]|nr:hypothetical protein GE09DRAFT_330251 [Coniochaeta sp. 2T2.1]
MTRMKRLRVPPLAVSILLNGLISSATTVSANTLVERANSAQCAPNFDPCPQAAELSWPVNFCCPRGSTCNTLAGNTTLLCCPPGFGCEAITTTGCQMDLYDADLHPDGWIKTTALNGVLDHCGKGTCCPFGYSCGTSDKGEPQCVKNKNQNPTPITTTPANPSTTSGSSSSTTTTTTQTTETQTTSIFASSTTTTTPGQNNGASSGADSTTTPTAEPAESNNKGASTAVIAGTAVGAAILVAALAFLAFIFFRRRHRKQQREEEEQAGDEAHKLSRSTSSFGNIISNPIVAAGATMRSDFVLRKSPGGGNGGGGQRSSVGSAVSTLVGGDGGGEPKTPSPSRSRMREGVGTTPTARIKPIRNMAAQARQSSIAYGVGGPGETSPYGGGGGNYHADDGRLPYPQTPPRRDGGGGGASDQPREPSSVSINVFADPRIATPQRNNNAGGGGSGAGGLRVPETPEMGGDSRAMSIMTTFSDMLRSADLGGVAKGEPYVPGSNLGTPASRRR